MFKIKPDPTFSAKVSLTVAGSDAPAILEVEFKHKGRVGLKAWLETIGDRSEVEVLGEVIVGWFGPVDEKGDPVPYSAAALDQLLDAFPPASGEIFESYRKALGESRAKNS
jgi:hypothetical protein